MPVRINRLTAEQAATMPKVREEWLQIGLSTDPVDRVKVREILGRLYGVIGKPAPKFIVHLDSPLHVLIAVAQMRSVCDQVNAQVHNQVRDQVRDVIRLSWHMDFGQFDVWLSWYDFISRCGIDVSMLHPTFELTRACGWSLLFWDCAFISDKPKHIHHDVQGRLHCETGPAVGYNGFSVFAVHGVRVPEKVVLAPENLTPNEIDAESNAEVRRVMIERYGQERYLMESKAEEIHRDEFGTLYRKEITGDEPLVMVKVVNSTPEPDGRYKDYFIRVPPDMIRARAAVAWTFGKTEAEYDPAVET